jgi:[ribosomal protein S18]-alanine N-acetyltransferase
MTTNLTFELTADESILKECAKMMSESDPWLTLRRNFNDCLEAVHGDNKEVYVAKDQSTIAGLIVLQMSGTFKGYIQVVCIKPDKRGQGIGSALIKFCEERIFKVSPNVFICVSSFNTEAAKLYYKLGYEKIGELKDFIVRGYSELLLRKTIGTISEFSGKNKIR